MSPRSSLAFLNLAHFLDHYFLLIFPTAVLALHGPWGATYADALAWGTPAFVAFALGTLPAGWLGDRWSRTGMLAVFFLGIGAASIATGLAQGPVSLMAALAALGLFAAIFHPVGLAMVSEATDTPGHALALNGVWGNMGLAGAALVTGLLSDAWSWRAAFIAPGCVSILVGMAYLAARHRARLANAAYARPRVALLDATSADRARVFCLIAVSALLGGLVFNGVTISLPKLFEERLSAIAGGLSQVGLAAALVFAVAAFAQLPVGRMLDRYGARPILIAVFALQGVFLFVVGAASGAATMIWAFPLLLAVFGALPVTGWLMARYVPGAWRARAFAFEYVISLGVGSAAVPMISVMHEAGGFARLFTVLAAFALVLFAAAFVLPARRRHVAAVPATAPRSTP